MLRFALGLCWDSRLGREAEGWFGDRFADEFLMGVTRIDLVTTMFGLTKVTCTFILEADLGLVI